MEGNERKVVNVFKGAQYVEHIDSQTNNYNYYGGDNANAIEELPSEKADGLLTEFIGSLMSVGKEGKELLAPYASAYMHGFAQKMGADDFNRKYGTSIGSTTFYNWMSPVFNGTESGRFLFTMADLSFYDKKFEELQK